MKTKDKTKKVLQITVFLLFIAAFLIPKGNRSYLMVGITATGLFVSLAIMVFPALIVRFRKFQTTKSQIRNTKNRSDLEIILLRQISYRITDRLQSSFPDATWEFTKEIKPSYLLNGHSVRLSTRNTGKYNYAEMSMDQYGTLHLKMMTVENLENHDSPSDSPKSSKPDPASWYSLIGKPFLVELIGNLQARGYQKVFINEQGDVYILNGTEPDIKGRLDHFPPKTYWPQLLDVLAEDELIASQDENTLEITWG